MGYPWNDPDFALFSCLVAPVLLCILGYILTVSV